MSNEHSSDQKRSDPSQPHWSRWALAIFISMLGAPLFSPLAWGMLGVEGADPPAFVAFFIWTYLFGLPMALIAVIIFSIIVRVFFNHFSRKPFWLWGASGAFVGLTFILPFVLNSFDMGNPGAVDYVQLMLFANGPVPGFAAGLIFRKILLK